MPRKSENTEKYNFSSSVIAGVYDDEEMLDSPVYTPVAEKPNLRNVVCI